MPTFDRDAFEDIISTMTAVDVAENLRTLIMRCETLLRRLRSPDMLSQACELAEAAHKLAGGAGTFGFFMWPPRLVVRGRSRRGRVGYSGAWRSSRCRHQRVGCAGTAGNRRDGHYRGMIWSGIAVYCGCPTVSLAVLGRWQERAANDTPRVLFLELHGSASLVLRPEMRCWLHGKKIA